jgi:hypothetical protein
MYNFKRSPLLSLKGIIKFIFKGNDIKILAPDPSVQCGLVPATTLAMIQLLPGLEPY